MVALAHVVGVAVGGTTAVPRGLMAAAVVATVVVSCAARSGAVVGVLVVVLSMGLWQGSRAWHEVRPDRLGTWNGWALVVADPVPRGHGTSVTFEVEGERFDSLAYGSAARRAQRLAVGDFVWLSGRRSAGEGDAARRAAVRHVVGRFDIEFVGDVRPGSPVAEAANRLRGALRRAAERTMTPDEAALFCGLVIGDDARQSSEMVDRFRAVGLSHLTAVSGQNVAFVLAAASPLLRRLGPRRRWLASLGLIAWFMVLTRFEPSVLRAGVMAGLAATAFVAGRPAPPVRLLAVSVSVLTTLDPMLVWSVGFWLSVAATVGVAVVAPRLERALPLPPWCSTAVAVTLGAQVGVAVPSLVVFGRLPIVAVVANPAAVPVAGAVMLVGVPSALLAALLPGRVGIAVGDLVMLPSRLGTRWVDQVARVAVALEPPPVVAAAGWCVVVAVLVYGMRRNRVARQTDVPI